MTLWTAFLLGFVGSLHCAGMCGPLVLALPMVGRTRTSFLLSRGTYNAGRMLTYGVLGVLSGVLGATVALAGFQRWLSLSAGLLILLAVVASSRHWFPAPAAQWVLQLKAKWGHLLRQRSYPALFSLGLLNGLLPCGLVYVACTAAATTGGLWTATEFMIGFGLGTLPMMLGIGWLGRSAHSMLRAHTQLLITTSLCVVALLLILRGLALGIPYLSPDLASGMSCCTP